MQVNAATEPVVDVSVRGGAPFTELEVSINGAPAQHVTAVVDSGGVYGTMPSSVVEEAGVMPTQLEALPNGTTVQVYTDDGQTSLYSYTVNSSDPLAQSPSVVDGAGAFMNTGNFPFAQQPVYISYSPASAGTTIFGGVAPEYHRRVTLTSWNGPDARL